MSTTYEELLQEMLDRAPNDVDKREGSIIYDALAPCAYFLTQMGFTLENFLDLVMPDTALEEYLDRVVSAYGITRKAATAAVRRMVTTGAVDVGTRWGIQSLIYTVTEAESNTSYKVTCETAGVIGNQYSGAMTPISNVLGVSATLTDIITDGTDEETDDALRERFYLKVQKPATSGNAYQYQQWALEVSGVGAAKVIPLDDGPGTVTVLVVDSDKEISAALPAVVAAYIEEVRPIGATVTVGSPAAVSVNVTASVTLDGTKTLEAVKESYEAALDAFLKDSVFSEYRLSFAKISALLLDTEGVADYENFTLNGTIANIILTEKQIPVLGTVTLTEVSA